MTNRIAGNRLKEFREKRGMSQMELSQLVGISRSAVSAIEGRALIPSVASALALARAFSCTVEALFGDREEPVEPVWAWQPARLPARFWQATTGARRLFYPVEALEGGSPEHDGCYSGEPPSVHNRFSPEKTLIIACCDPAAGILAAHLAEQEGVRLIALPRSSREALKLLAAGLVHGAGIHLAASNEANGNAAAAREALGPGYELLRLADWQDGLAVTPRLGVRNVAGALRSGLRWVGRESGSGARQCLDELRGTEPAPKRIARNHRGVADAIACGWADAGVCLRLTSEEAGLDFFSLREECFDLCFPSSLKDDVRIQALVRTVRARGYRRVLGELPGYDSSATGELQSVG